MRKQLFFSPEANEWKALIPDTSKGTNGAKKQQNLSETTAARDEFKALLLSSLQMQHVLVLAGSGTSLGDLNGPSMQTLWNHCVNSNPDNQTEKPTPRKESKAVMDEVGYEDSAEHQNIEELLSRCDAYLQFKSSNNIRNFVSE